MRIITALTAYCCVWSMQVNGFDTSPVEYSCYLFGQYVSTTTLRWVSGTNGLRPKDAVVATEETLPGEAEEYNLGTCDFDEAKLGSVIKRRIYLCRAFKDGIWTPGQLEYQKKACLVSSSGEVSSFTEYEVLNNLDDMARLNWVNFSSIDAIPDGAIVVGYNEFIARRITDKKDCFTLGRKHLVGKMKLDLFLSNITVITEDGKERDFSEGELLVVVEPKRYELDLYKFNYTRNKISEKRLLLGTAILNNTESSSMRVNGVINYDEQYSMSWGQDNTISTFPYVKIRLHGEVLMDVSWGIQHPEKRRHVYKVEAFLEPGTAVNVSLVGYHTITEIPYNGKLVAIYDDGMTKTRNSTGIQGEEAIKEIVATYSQAYYLSNLSLVPTSTTTTTSTTVTPITISTNPTPQATDKTKKTDKKIQNVKTFTNSGNDICQCTCSCEKQ